MIDYKEKSLYSKLIEKYYKLRSSTNYSALDFNKRVQSANELLNGLKNLELYHYRRSLDQYNFEINSKFDRNNHDVSKMVNLASNDYLGFTKNKEIQEVSSLAITNFGQGSGSVPMLSGTLSIHRKLEKSLAEFTEQEAALTFNSCFSANYGVLTSFLSNSDVAILDTYVHASIIDGCSRTNKIFFKHNDVESLKWALKKASVFKNILVIVEGVYSMDGDIAQLDQIISVAKENGAWVMIDESHALGVIGKNGKGTTSYFQLFEKADIITGSLGKALGGIGGFISSSKSFIDLMEITNRPFIYSTSIPPNIVVGLIKALELLNREDNSLYQLWDNIRYFKENIIDKWPELKDIETPIFPLIIGNEEKLAYKCKELYNNGIFVNPIFYPVVPKRKARIRISITASLSKKELDYSIEKIKI